MTMEEKASEEHIVQGGEESVIPTDKVIGADDATAAEQLEADNLPEKPKPKLCGICEKEDGKYKCPRCSLP